MNYKLLFLGLWLFVFVLFLLPVQAAETGATADQPATTTTVTLPDSPWYGIKNFWANVRIFFTVDPIKNIQRRLDLAQAQIIATKQFVDQTGDKADNKVLERALKNYTETIAQTAKRSNGLSDTARAEIKDYLTLAITKQEVLVTALKNKLANDPTTKNNTPQIQNYLNQDVLAQIKVLINKVAPTTPDNTVESDKTEQEKRFLTCMQSCLNAGGTAILCEPDCKKQASVSDAILKRLEWIESRRPTINMAVPPPPTAAEQKKMDDAAERAIKTWQEQQAKKPQ